MIFLEIFILLDSPPLIKDILSQPQKRMVHMGISPFPNKGDPPKNGSFQPSLEDIVPQWGW